MLDREGPNPFAESQASGGREAGNLQVLPYERWHPTEELVSEVGTGSVLHRAWMDDIKANLASSVRTVKRSLNFSLSNRIFLPPQPPPTEISGNENGIVIAVRIAE